jgi:hypothetical protein
MPSFQSRSMNQLLFLIVVACIGVELTCAVGRGDSLAAAVELDHVYLYAPQRSSEAAVVASLTSAGLTVQPQRNDFGDGVVGRYVRFDNPYLELLWYDGTTATDEDSRRRAAWESSGASPFGVGMRRRPGVPDVLPFPTRPFSAPWLRPGTELRKLGTEGDSVAPDLFVEPAYLAYRGTGSHPLGVHRLTGVRVIVLPAGLSDATRLVSDGRIATIGVGSEPAMFLAFDGGTNRRSVELRPLLPLTLSY